MTHATSTLLFDKSFLAKEVISPTRRRNRFLTHIIDLFFYYIVYMAVFLIWGLTAVFQSEESIESGIRFLENTGLIYLVNIGSFIAYYVTFEGIFGKTLGKMIMNTRVVNEDGSKPSFATILGRTLARLIPFEPFSFLSSAYPRGWHDTISKTMVINDSSLQVLERLSTERSANDE